VPSRTDRLLLAALLLLNLVLKCSWLGLDPLFNDEPFTVYWSQQPWKELWAMLATENNPPLYFLLMKAWSTVVPFEEAWLRLPAAVFSSLVVLPLYRIALFTGGRRAALVATLLFTCTNYHYGFAHEVRAYALFTLLTVTSAWLLVRSCRAGVRYTTLLLAVVNVLLVYTHFFGWLVIGLQGVLVLLLPELRGARRSVGIAAAAALVSYLPYLPLFAARMGQSVGQGTWLEPPQVEELYNMLWRWSNQPVLVVGFIVVIAVALWRTKAKDLGLRIGLLWAFLPLFGLFLVSFAVPVFLDRYLVFGAPGFALAVATALGQVSDDRRVTTAIPVAAVLGMAFTFHPWQGKGRDPSKAVEQALRWQEGEHPVLIAPGYFALTYAWHLDKELLRGPKPLELALIERNVFRVDHPDHFVALESDEEAVILVDAASRITDPEQRTKGHLRDHWPRVDSVEVDHKLWVYRFRR